MISVYDVYREARLAGFEDGQAFELARSILLHIATVGLAAAASAAVEQRSDPKDTV